VQQGAAALRLWLGRRRRRTTRFRWQRMRQAALNQLGAHDPLTLEDAVFLPQCKFPWQRLLALLA